jgi:membrane fusion protein (multidrug efflux system)
MSTAAEKTPTIEPDHRKHKRNVWMGVLAAVFLFVGLIWLLYWLIIGRFYAYTEDAYVHGNEVMLTPQVSAGVRAIYADETNLVKKGQLVVELDSSNFEIRVEELKKNLANQVREVSHLFQDVEAKGALVNLRKAELRQAELDFQHREPLVRTGAVSKEEYETYQTNVYVAESELRFAEKEFEAAKALIEGTSVETHPRVQMAVWQLKQAYLDLLRCQIWSPVTGYIAKRNVQVGDQVEAGQTLLFIVPLDYIWVNANYKETQLSNVRIGQPVTFTADLYGRRLKYHGLVIGFQPGSGNAFSLLPPENASGNWIKIIQRVPVRISIDPEEIKKNPLMLGLSTRVSVDVHDISGKTLAERPTCEPIYTTPIYAMQLENMALLDPLIDELIEKNKTPKES